LRIGSPIWAGVKRFDFSFNPSIQFHSATLHRITSYYAQGFVGHGRANGKKNKTTKGKLLTNFVFLSLQGTPAAMHMKAGVKSLVPRAGLEPARVYTRGILSPLRLPIPPSRHNFFALLKLSKRFMVYHTKAFGKVFK
jgi:hypothetical protein